MLSRRRFLSGLAVAGVLGAAGCTLPETPRRERARCVARSDLPRFAGLGDARWHYELPGEPREFHIDADFYRQLDDWWADWLATTRLGPADRIDSYGAWVDGRGACDSWHHAGRAFDLARLRRDGEVVVSCREDLWAGAPDEQEQRRRYWSLAAHLHIHFAHVLTYLFDAQHRNHIHIDNGLSGAELSTFRSGSRVQVQAVQAIARWLFDEGVEITGRWDATTRRAVDAVLASLDRSGGLGTQDNWHAYLRAAAQRG